MTRKISPIPVIDLFAGPGGLGEGFSRVEDGDRRCFKSVLSIEMDPSAHRTLTLRSFFRQFPSGKAPDDYYRFLRQEITVEELYESHPKEANHAKNEAWLAELGVESNTQVRDRIKAQLGDADPWVLLGGPPCQPFSNAGRSRNAPGSNTKYSDGKETRHNLYREYLQIIADFWPAVFVMENVKGMLSAKFDGKPAFARIKADLRDPAAVFGNQRRQTGRKHKYRLFALAPTTGLFADDPEDRDYLVRCENHGIPQARHRLILLGVRDDIESDCGVPGILEHQKPVPARRVLSAMPPLRSGLSKGDSLEARRVVMEDAWGSKWLTQVDPKTLGVIEDALRSLRKRDEDRGGQYFAVPPRIGISQEWFLDKKLKGLCNHHARSHMASDLHRYLFAAAFSEVHERAPKLADFPKDLLPAHKNAKNPNATTKFADRFRVQHYDRPSTTVVSHIAKDGHYYIHPDPTQCRSLTVREAARLQTFPDNYFFMGNRTQQYHQVGNAVPPLLANQIGELVADYLGHRG